MYGNNLQKYDPDLQKYDPDLQKTCSDIDLNGETCLTKSDIMKTWI